jgi:hypothetical protein
MLKRLATSICVLAVSGVALGAQTKPAPKPLVKPAVQKPELAQKADAPKPAPAPAEVALPYNIKLEVSITDQTGAGPGAKKVVSMIVGDRQNTSIRSSASVPVKQAGNMGFTYRTVTINVDARPAIILKEPSKILVSFGLEYFPKAPASTQEETEPGMASINERLGLILESGKPLVISQAADPASDRRITVEVTATILK